jgi:hypothetical protein
VRKRWCFYDRCCAVGRPLLNLQFVLDKGSGTVVTFLGNADGDNTFSPPDRTRGWLLKYLHQRFFRFSDEGIEVFVRVPSGDEEDWPRTLEEASDRQRGVGGRSFNLTKVGHREHLGRRRRPTGRGLPRDYRSRRRCGGRHPRRATALVDPAGWRGHGRLEPDGRRREHRGPVPERASRLADERPGQPLLRPPGDPVREAEVNDPGFLGGSDARICPGGRRCSSDGQTEEVLR